jgi:hypothetical protein
MIRLRKMHSKGRAIAEYFTLMCMLATHAVTAALSMPTTAVAAERYRASGTCRPEASLWSRTLFTSGVRLPPEARLPA